MRFKAFMLVGFMLFLQGFWLMPSLTETEQGNKKPLTSQFFKNETKLSPVGVSVTLFSNVGDPSPKPTSPRGTLDGRSDGKSQSHGLRQNDDVLSDPILEEERKPRQDDEVLVGTGEEVLDENGPLACGWPRAKETPEKYFLTAVTHVRLYEGDKAVITADSVVQWMEWMFFIGVEHIYLYDSACTPEEAVSDDRIDRFAKLGLVTVVTPPHKPCPFSMGIQAGYYRHAASTFPHSSWRVVCDVDEYISPGNSTPPARPPAAARAAPPGAQWGGFLAAFLATLPDDTAYVRLQNLVFGGQRELPAKSPNSPRRAFQYRTRTSKPEVNTLKYVVRPAATHGYDIHTASVSGRMLLGDWLSQVRLNHFWGPRVKPEHAAQHYVRDDYMAAPLAAMEALISQCPSHVPMPKLE